MPNGIDASYVTVATVRPADFVLSPDGGIIYTAGTDGVLRSYDAYTGQLLRSQAIGHQLGAIDISPDGRFVIATERVPVASRIVDPWWDSRTTVAAYKVDVATGEKTTFLYHGTSDQWSLSDVAILTDGSAYFTESIFPGWSGWSPLVRLDLSTGRFNAVGVNSFYQDGALTVDPDREDLIIGQLALSSAEYFRFDPQTQQIVADNGIYENGVYGYAAGMQAYSGDAGRAGMVAIATGGALHLYDGDFHYLANLSNRLHGLRDVGGLAFDASGRYLYVLDVSADAIVQISTDTLAITNSFTIGGDPDFTPSAWGNELVVGPNDSYFLVLTTKGLLLVDNPTVIDAVHGTAQPDVLKGYSGPDVLRGLDGNDVLKGNDGDDRLEGGAGSDRLVGGAGSDLVYGGDGRDTIDGGIGNDTLKGDDGDDVVLLNFASGTDRIDGGAGYDTIRIVGNSVALVWPLVSSVEMVNGGAYANFRIVGTAGDDVMDLTGVTLRNVARIDGGDGNDTIRGSAGGDTLYGGLGDDTLYGGDGNDVFAVTANSGVDTIYGGNGTDAIRGVGNSASLVWPLVSGIEAVDGGGYSNFRILGTSGDDSIDLSQVTIRRIDRIDGGEGRDAIHGSVGGDLIYGSGGDDSLYGGDGRDALHGGAGSDTLAGGAGKDSFWFDARPDGIAVDAILDFTAADDVIRLAHGAFAALPVGNLAAPAFYEGTAAHDASDRILYDAATGDIFYDPDGTGAQAALLFAHVAPHTPLTNADFVVA